MNAIDTMIRNLEHARRVLPSERHNDLCSVNWYDARVQIIGPPIEGCGWSHGHGANTDTAYWSVEIDGLTVHGCLPIAVAVESYGATFVEES